MIPRSELTKLIAINALVFFVLFNMVYWALPLVELVKSSIWHDRVVIDPRSQLPNYQGITWAAQHYRELDQLRTAFKSFVGWRREPFEGETITVIGPYGQRRTINSVNSFEK